MVSINYSSREVCCKIVYYGPGLSGKTTNLQYVHSKVPQDTRGKLISLATEADRTLYFDFLPINIGTINGFAAKFQLYTVPGQVYYNATRKLVLRGVDGLVFVADSQPDKMDENIESLTNLEENLREYGYDVDRMPLVIQYNKRDLPGVMSVEELDRKLNLKKRPTFEASATIGNGVFDTLKLIIKLVLEHAKNGGQQQPSTSANEQSPTTDQPTATPMGKSVSGEGQSSSAVTSGGVAVAEKPADADSAYRPFPGSAGTGQVRQQVVPESSSTSPVAPVGRSETSTQTSSMSSQSTDLSRPAMAPSLRRRADRKKRGFFKRLFGKK